MSRFFDIDAANAALPELRTILEALRDERAQLIELRDSFEQQASVEAARRGGESGPRGGESGPPGGSVRERPDEDPGPVGDAGRRIRLRMQGVIDQMQAGVARIDDLGVTLRDIESGLIDFPALVSGRQVWLCWRLGEGDLAWWHEMSDGFGGRRSLADLA